MRTRTLIALLFLAATFGSSVTGAEDTQAGKKSGQAESSPALQGYCPVAYSVMQEAVKGDPKISLEVDGHKYLFANADARKMFKEHPEKYTVAFGGWCATAASMNQLMVSDPKQFLVQDGVTYLFSSSEAKAMFSAEPAKFAYRPAYDGLCVTGLSMGEKMKGDPALFVVQEGRTLLFSSTEAKAMFEKDPKGVSSKAEAQWAKLGKS